MNVARIIALGLLAATGIVACHRDPGAAAEPTTPAPAPDIGLLALAPTGSTMVVQCERTTTSTLWGRETTQHEQLRRDAGFVGAIGSLQQWRWLDTHGDTLSVDTDSVALALAIGDAQLIAPGQQGEATPIQVGHDDDRWSGTSTAARDGNCVNIELDLSPVLADRAVSGARLQISSRWCARALEVSRRTVDHFAGGQRVVELSCEPFPD